MSEWEQFKAYAGIVADAKKEERERILKAFQEYYSHTCTGEWGGDEKQICHPCNFVTLIKGETE